MAFFGANNNNSSTFGGFGGSNTGGGFGANNNNTSSGGSLFGGNNTATSGGFGGGFGSNNASSPFGQNKPAFGAPATTSSGGGLFGGGTSTSGGFGSSGGGFGNTTSTGGFGSNTGGGLFGQNKPAATGFGASNTGGSLFGGGNTGGGFGSTAPASNPFSSNANTNTTFGSNTNAGGGLFGGGAGGGGFGASTAASNNNNGTGAVPFTAFNEKDGANNTTSSYQSIAFQEPYKNKSYEELRVEDYAQGRRYGNTNGQAGAFGQSTGFGGFGQQPNTSSGGGLFGNQNNTATSGSTFGGFGNTNAATNTAGAFGSNTGGGLFGQNKPAGGGLFGGNAASSTPATGFGTSTSGSGGGLFGSSTNNQSNPFGASSSTGGGLFGQQNNQQQSNAFGSTSTGGGLFGNQNQPQQQQPQQQQQQQNKPFGGFGSSTNAGTAFGGNTSTGGGGLFGNNNQQQQSNPFGASNTNSGGGLFGSQNKPAGGGLFGSNNATNTGGGLFGGGASQNNTGGGLFSNTGNQNNTGGGLFGSQNQNQNKPAGAGIFGGGAGATSGNTGGGLFNNNANAGGSSLFNQNKPAGSSLFGNTNTNTGGGLFGGNQQQNSGGSLFGGNAGNTGGSLFGNTTNQNQQPQNATLFGNSNNQQQQPNQLHASLTGAPYGNEQLFASLASPSPPVGPLATPLSGAKPAPKKTPSLMASMRLNSPVYTPRAGGSLGRTGGYGFTYSTYGTPGSAFSGSLTPGASSMLKPTNSFSSALTSRLNKSVSMGNLRGDGTPGERPSLLREAPGSGSVRKLKIDRSLRNDLFQQSKTGAEDSTKRAVSFTESPTEQQKAPKETSSSGQNALVRTETDDIEQEESPSLLRAAPQPNGGRPEMTQINGINGALTTVPEDSAAAPRPGSAPATQQTGLRKDDIGDYYTVPPIRDLKNMSRSQLQHIGSFTVGREGVGRIEFGPCDLSTTPLDDICGNIVRLVTRSATVYQDDANKPPMGRGLNVPSTIYLENSWPRSRGGKKAVHAKEGKELEKHIARLKRVGGTKFLKYDADTGVWSFAVEHFTTYGLDDDDDEDFTEDIGESSALSEPPETPSQQHDETMRSMETSPPDEDTFQFKLQQRSLVNVPGGFSERGGVSYDYDDPSADEDMEDEREDNSDDAEMEDPFTSPGGPVLAPSPRAIERYNSSMMEDQNDDVQEQASPEMPGTFVPEPKMPRPILKQTATAFTSPEKLATDTWEEQLQRTISPKKRDRQALKDVQQSAFRQAEVGESPFKQSLFGQSILGRSTLGQSYLASKSTKKGKPTAAQPPAELGKSQAFKTSMDIMNSLWGNEKSGNKAVGGRGFEYPYSKKPRPSTSADLDERDAAFHDNLRPSFAADGTLVYAASGPSPRVSGELQPSIEPLVCEHKDVRFAKFTANPDVNAVALQSQKSITEIEKKSTGMPYATISESNIMFAGAAILLESSMPATPSTLEKHELAIWQLCSTLFDPIDVSCRSLIKDLPKDHVQNLADRIKLDAFSGLWSTFVASSVEDGLKRAKSAEERAILLLTKNDVPGACEALIANKDFRLAILVSQLPGSESSRTVMRKQIEAWQKRKDWSEMSDATRALYAILAGIVYVVPGDGLQRPAPEDKASPFCITERFHLSWQQSLALRVLFGGHATLKDAIKAYCTDMEAENSTEAHPTTVWYQENGGEKFADMEDTLMQLCRLYADGTDLDELFSALSVSGSLVNTRLAWQLASLLHSHRIVDLEEGKRAQLALDFATELEAAGLLVDSAWILLHLEDDVVRQRAVTGLLQRNADKISNPPANEEEENSFTQLTRQLAIPQATVFAAKALYAKAMGDPLAQARWLLRAGHDAEAHEVLCVTVGPQAVIEQDYAGLSELIFEFPSRRPAGWEQGGQVFETLASLFKLSSAQKSGGQGEILLRSLRRNLKAVEEDKRAKTLAQRVALIEMKRISGELARDIESVEEKRTGNAEWDRSGYGEGVGLLDKYYRALGQVV